MNELKPLPVGPHTFVDLIRGGYHYVDKTPLIYELIRHSKGIYFLARPRRFGKSLLVSTLEEIFQGNKEIFQGLWLYNSDYSWNKHPIIRIDFSGEPVQSAPELIDSIQRILALCATEHGITLTPAPYYAQWQELIRKLAVEKQVVVLIDEYDKPLIHNLTNLEEARQMRTVLKGFYSVLKGMDRYLRFVFLTGISKFSKVGVFSDLNHLRDISMENDFAELPGITEEELVQNFQPYLEVFAKQDGLSTDDLLVKIRDWYNGFRFSRRNTTVYNPFSLMLLLTTKEFRNYWFESGTPTFLLNLMHDAAYDPQRLQNRQVGELAFSSYELENLDILTLLYQTGYLTIKAYDTEAQLYTLGYPNREVEDAFLTYLLGSFSSVEKGISQSYLWQLVRALRANKLQEFFDVLTIFFAEIPYSIQIKREKYYQTIFYLLFTLIGLRAQAEVITTKGRVDAVVEVDEGIYIFEFKLNGSEEEALTQIKTMAYYERYRGKGKVLYLVGVNFSTRKRGVGKWVVERL